MQLTFEDRNSFTTERELAKPFELAQHLRLALGWRFGVCHRGSRGQTRAEKGVDIKIEMWSSVAVPRRAVPFHHAPLLSSPLT